jgi:hypothetical protein
MPAPWGAHGVGARQSVLSACLALALSALPSPVTSDRVSFMAARTVLRSSADWADPTFDRGGTVRLLRRCLAPGSPTAVDASFLLGELLLTSTGEGDRAEGRLLFDAAKASVAALPGVQQGVPWQYAPFAPHPIFLVHSRFLLHGIVLVASVFFHTTIVKHCTHCPN